MAVFGRFLRNTFSIIALLVTFSVQAADDEYLQQLESEVKGIHLDKSGQHKNNGTAHTHNATDNVKGKVWVGECDYVNGVMPKGLVQAEFSSYLEQCSLAIFAYYRRLDSDLQHSVYDTYAEAPTMKLSKLQKNILTYF